MALLPLLSDRISRLASVLVKRKAITRGCDRFLNSAVGIVHVGANTGQERGLYDSHALNVIWVEPIPNVFRTLSANIAAYPRQVAFQRLLAAADGVKLTLNVSNNNGESSSILPFGGHSKLWPEVQFIHSLEIEAVTLSTFLAQEAVDMLRYDALVLDTQGSELLVLKGAIDVLPHFRFVKCEVADFESYVGCCQLSDLDAFMIANGFKSLERSPFAGSKTTGSYYDVLYERDLPESGGNA